MVLAATFAVGLVHAAPLDAQSYLIYGADQYFKLDWEAGKSRRGAPIVSGYIYNTYGAQATDMRVQVEALDASGATTATQVYQLPGSFPNDTRTYFEVRVPPAPAYRVRVASWNWQRGGSQ